MKQTLLMMLLVLCIPLFCTEYSDVVYLNNGSVIHGNIVELQPEVLVKIQTADGNLFVFEMNDVSKIDHEEHIQSEGTNYFFAENHPVFMLIKGGLMFAGNVVYEGTSVGSVDNCLTGGIIIGGNISHWVALGLGLDYIDFPNGYAATIYSSFRLKLAQTGSIYVVSDIGYHSETIDDVISESKGPYLNVGLGAWSHHSAFIEFTYRTIWTDTELSLRNYHNEVIEAHLKSQSNYLTLMLGYCF